MQERDGDQDAGGKTGKVGRILPTPRLKMPDDIDADRCDETSEEAGTQSCRKVLTHYI